MKALLNNKLKMYLAKLGILDKNKALWQSLPALADFGLTDAILTDLQEKIDAFTGRVSSPRTTRSDNRASNETMDSQFHFADLLLEEEIDRLMKVFKMTQPEFFAAYTAAREI